MCASANDDDDDDDDDDVADNGGGLRIMMLPFIDSILDLGGHKSIRTCDNDVHRLIDTTKIQYK